MPFVDVNNNQSPQAQGGGQPAPVQPVAQPVDPDASVRQVEGPAFDPAPPVPQPVQQLKQALVNTNVAQSASLAEPNSATQLADDMSIVTGAKLDQQQASESQPEPAELVLGTEVGGDMPPEQLSSEPAVEPQLPIIQEIVEPQQENAAPVEVMPSEQAQPIEDELPASSDLPSMRLGELPPLAAATTTPYEVARMPQAPSTDGEVLDNKQYTLHDLLSQSVAMGASDLHLTSGYRAVARVDGKLLEIKSEVLDGEIIRKMLEEVVKNNPKADLSRQRDIDLSYEIKDPHARFRVNIFLQRGDFSAVFRVVPSSIRTPDELRLPQVVKQFTTLQQGLVLVTGPTGSGKTTTLAGLVNQINLTEPKHIITIEDPVEYVYPKGMALVDQRAVYIDTKNWTTALRAALRQDPDVVLIGEMRDIETMEAALQVAETGHLVFSTLHTNSAAQTIDRIIDAFPDEKQSQVRTQLAGTLMAVVSQRLIPITGGGRRVAAEIMVVNAAIRNAIRENKVYQIDNMIQTGAELGMITMEKALVALVREGVISTEAAQQYANRPEDVVTLLSKN